MSWTALGASKTNQSSASSSSLTASTWSTNAAVGDLLVFFYSGNFAAGTTFSGGDNSAQAGAVNVYSVIGPAEGSASLSIACIWCVFTRSLANTDTLTLTASAAATRSAMRGRTYRSSIGSVAIDPAGSVLVNNDNTSPIAPTTGTLAASGELAVCGTAVRAGAAITPTDASSGWGSIGSIDSGGATTVVSLGVNANTSAGTAATTDSQAWTAYTTGAGVIGSWQEGVTPPVTGVSSLALLGVGT